MRWEHWIYTIPLRLRSILRRSRVEQELEEELRFHLEYQVRTEIASGSTPEEARRAALRAMDGLEQRKEECRDMRRVNHIDNLVRDVRYAVRALGRTPQFTLAALLALALGIGATTAIFSVVNGVLLRPLPYRHSGRLMVIYDSFQQQGMEHGPGGIADFLDWKSRAHSLESLDAVAFNRFTLVGDGDAEQIIGLGVTSTFFDTLGVRPRLGRTFQPGDDQPGRPASVVISERLWRRRYSSSPSVLGKVINLNGRPTTVIGVMPPTFRFGDQAEVWSILTLDPPSRRGPFFLRGLARLKPGVTREQAASDLESIANAVERENPKDYTHLHFPVLPLQEAIVGDVRPLLWIFSGAVLLVFLIAVSNVANLMLARATTRRREIAVRLSIGAGRGQLVRQFMTESLLLALAGGGCGIALALWGVATLRWLEPRGLPRLEEIGVDTRVLLFTLIASLMSAILFGLAPALSSGRAALTDAMNQRGSGGESRGRGRARSALVVTQVTFSVLLLIGAGLMIRSFMLLGRVQPGFQALPDHVLTMLISPTGPRFREPKAIGAYWDRLLERIGALPGVQAASVAVTIPPDRVAFTDGYEIERKPMPAGSERVAVPIPFVSRDYLKTLGIPLLRGRWFDNRDTADAPAVVVISEALARQAFPGENPIGQRMKHGGRGSPNPFVEIVGVVGDTKYQGLDNGDTPVFYKFASQAAMRPMWLLVRTQQPASALAAGIRKEIAALDAGVPVDRVSTMAQAMAESVSLPRFRSLAMSIFAVTALLLAAIGIYSVIAYTVLQRTQEIGIRMALGATPSGVLKLVVARSGRLTLIGVGIGVAGAFGLVRFLAKMLFGVTPFDAFTFAGSALTLTVVAVIAALAPALRAARVDPVTALRHE